MKKLFLFINIFSTITLFGMQEQKNKELSEQESDRQYLMSLPPVPTEPITFFNEISANDVEKLPDDVLRIIKKQVIGDDLKTTDKFLPALNLKIDDIKNITEIKLTENGDYLIVCTRITVYIIDLESTDRVLIKHQDCIEEVRLSENNRYLFTKSNDGCVKVYDFKNRKEHVIQHNGRILKSDIFEEYDFIYTCSEDKTIKITNLDLDPLLPFALQSDLAIRGIAFSNDKRYVCIINLIGQIEVYDFVENKKTILQKGDEDTERLMSPSIDHNQLDISLDNRFLVVFLGIEKILTIFDLRNKLVVKVFQDVRCSKLAISDLNILICTYEGFLDSSKITFYDLEKITDQGYYELVLRDKSLDNLSITHNKIIFRSDVINNNELSISSEDLRSNIKLTEDLPIEYFCVAPDGKKLIYLLNDNTVQIYDLESNQKIDSYDLRSDDFDLRSERDNLNNSHLYKKIDISNNSQYVIVYLGKRVNVLDLVNRKQDYLDFGNYTMQDDYIIKINPNNRELILANKNNGNGELEIYDLETLHRSFLCRHKDSFGIENIFLFDDKYIIAAYTSGRIGVFDLIKKQEMYTTKLCQSRETKACKTLASDKNIIMWCKNIIKIHKIDKSMLHDLSINQIKFIIDLYDQYHVSQISLSHEQLKIFNTLPEYVKKSLVQNYDNMEVSIK